MSFRFVPKSVTLNDLGMTLSGVMAVTLPYFTEFGSFRDRLRKSS